MVSVTTTDSVLEPEVYDQKIMEFYNKMKEVKKGENAAPTPGEKGFVRSLVGANPVS